MEMEMGLKDVSGWSIWKALEGIGRMAMALRYLPFCQCRKAKEHRYGCLRLWPKAKSVRNPKRSWKTLTFRPLVSYRQHRFRRLFSMVSRL